MECWWKVLDFDFGDAKRVKIFVSIFTHWTEITCENTDIVSRPMCVELLTFSARDFGSSNEGYQRLKQAVLDGRGQSQASQTGFDYFCALCARHRQKSSLLYSRKFQKIHDKVNSVLQASAPRGHAHRSISTTPSLSEKLSSSSQSPRHRR